MPEYIVVCCYSCKLFQGQQQNKQKKFKCKVCGEKQSVRHIFAKSDYPKDIRPIVQELNQKRVEMNEKATSANLDDSEYILPNQTNEISQKNKQGESLWTQFIQPTSTNQNCVDNEEDSQYITDTSILKPRLRKEYQNKERKRSYQHKQKARIQEPPIRETIQPHAPVFESIMQNSKEEDCFVTDLNDIVKQCTKEEKSQKCEKIDVAKDSIWSSFL